MISQPQKYVHERKPPWLRLKLPHGGTCEEVRRLVNRGRLHTVCREARCPNMWECFSKGNATFLIMGPQCTRQCRFCGVGHGPCDSLDPEEPIRVARAVEHMGLRYVVVTSVTRDDLPDGGSSHFARTIGAIRSRSASIRVEVLIPDFQGDRYDLYRVLEAAPDVLSHNMETIERLYPLVRPGAGYARSLKLLKRARMRAPGIATKSGFMLGLGEERDEIRRTLEHLLEAGCTILTLGQYLQPTKDHIPVSRYVPPDEFAGWKKVALEMGFLHVSSGPFVRSSYRAEEYFHEQEQEGDV